MSSNLRHSTIINLCSIYIYLHVFHIIITLLLHQTVFGRSLIMNRQTKCVVCTNKKWCICKHKHMKALSKNCERCLCCYTKAKFIAESRRGNSERVRAEMNEYFKFILRVYVEIILKDPETHSDN